MLPQFPKFDRLAFKHKQEVEKIISPFPPYSDYNFSSIWSYNVDKDVEISTLHGNLILSFRDYITNAPFHSFIGTHNIKNTIDTLLKHTQSYMKLPYIKLIPEIVVTSNRSIQSHFLITEDPDNHDYVVLLDDLSNTSGRINSDKRREINKLHRIHSGIEHRVLNLSNKKIHEDLYRIFLVWAQQKKLLDTDSQHEFIAMQRLLSFIPATQLVCIGIYKQEPLIAFSISEKITNEYAIGHFMKADFTHDGVYEYLRTVTATYLKSLGCIYLNCEQDLGKPGLRQSKQAMKPTHFLKKYIISPKK